MTTRPDVTPTPCAECGRPLELVSRRRRFRRAGQSIQVGGWAWSCSACTDPQTGQAPFVFTDAALGAINDELVRRAWQERFGEPLPTTRRGRPTSNPRTVRVPVLLTVNEAERLDELRGEVSRSEWLRRGLQAAG